MTGLREWVRSMLGYPDAWEAQVEAECERRMYVHSEWQRANRTKVKAYVQKWRAKNPEKVREIRREGMRRLRARRRAEMVDARERQQGGR